MRLLMVSKNNLRTLVFVVIVTIRFRFCQEIWWLYWKSWGIFKEEEENQFGGIRQRLWGKWAAEICYPREGAVCTSRCLSCNPSFKCHPFVILTSTKRNVSVDIQVTLEMFLVFRECDIQIRCCDIIWSYSFLISGYILISHKYMNHFSGKKSSQVYYVC